MVKGYVCLVLHTHMPYVRHIDVIDPLEERWLFEAMSECYIPLLSSFDKLTKDNINFKLTMSMTPPILCMLNDEYLNKRYLEHLNKTIELTEKELLRNKDNKELYNTSCFYKERFEEILKIYKAYDCNLINGFKRFLKQGNLEIITCSATHAILPLLLINKKAVEAQIRLGVETYERVFSQKPKGIWLPECAYTYELDEMLLKYGLKYFISEGIGILNASPKPKYKTYAPIVSPKGLCAFGRDYDSSSQVWSNTTGYPGDYNYREFYRDIGFDLPIEYIGPYINQSGIRIDTGLKYHKITGNTANKGIYNRKNALGTVLSHAKHFADSRENQIREISQNMDVLPIITCPYDTELFGHWWFEGPDFIEAFIRETYKGNRNYTLTSPLDYIREVKKVQISSPCPSTWGEHSDFSVWLNPSNDYMYKDLHRMEAQMIDLVNITNNPDTITKRALNQAARELMLAESSDWAFIVKHNTSVQYAKTRFHNHKERFYKLHEQIKSNSIDKNFLCDLENIDNIFKNMNYEIYK